MVKVHLYVIALVGKFNFVSQQNEMHFSVRLIAGALFCFSLPNLKQRMVNKMQRIEPKDLYVKYCLNFCMQIRKEGRLKYFTLLKMKAEDVETYSDWLCDCDSLGFHYLPLHL